MSGPIRPEAYAPLRPGTLLWQLTVLVIAKVALYASYATHEAQLHWATHFLVGLTVASLWQALFLLVAARPTRFQLLSILGFHLWAMWPDLVFRAPGIPHYSWMGLGGAGPCQLGALRHRPRVHLIHATAVRRHPLVHPMHAAAVRHHPLVNVVVHLRGVGRFVAVVVR